MTIYIPFSFPPSPAEERRSQKISGQHASEVWEDPWVNQRFARELQRIWPDGFVGGLVFGSADSEMMAYIHVYLLTVMFCYTFHVWKSGMSSCWKPTWRSWMPSMTNATKSWQRVRLMVTVARFQVAITWSYQQQNCSGSACLSIYIEYLYIHIYIAKCFYHSFLDSVMLKASFYRALRLPTKSFHRNSQGLSMMPQMSWSRPPMCDLAFIINCWSCYESLWNKGSVWIFIRLNIPKIFINLINLKFHPTTPHCHFH